MLAEEAGAGPLDRRPPSGFRFDALPGKPLHSGALPRPDCRGGMDAILDAQALTRTAPPGARVPVVRLQPGSAFVSAPGPARRIPGPTPCANACSSRSGMHLPSAAAAPHSAAPHSAAPHFAASAYTAKGCPTNRAARANCNCAVRITIKRARRAGRFFDDNTHADRWAPPGRNPGRRRQG